MRQMSRNKKVLRIIPKPEEGTRTVLAPKVLPAIKGQGDTDFLCGNCERILVEGIYEGQIRNIVIRCPICRFYNEVF